MQFSINDEHRARLVAGAREVFEEAAEAGRRSAGGSIEPDPATVERAVSDALAVLGGRLGSSLRSRISVRASEQSDWEDLSAVLRPIYREIRAQHLEGAVSESLLVAFARGHQFGDPARSSSTWLVHPHCGNPDCGDNGLAGPVELGDEFPSGHVGPPTHASCGCLAGRDR